MSLPVNFQEFSPANIEDATAYAIGLARAELDVMRELGVPLTGSSVLELGPGTDFAPALILASMGMRATVADRFLSPFQAQYHPALYRRIAELWDGPTGELLAAAEGGYEATSLVRLAEPAEDLAGIESGSIDFSFSNAVFEHVLDFGAVAAELARVARRGGKGAHQIDLRDHRSFDRPLEHLVMAEREYRLTAEDVHNEFGNRYRTSEFDAHFNAQGLRVRDVRPNGEASSDYLAALVPRLRQSRSAYRNWPESDLRTISVQFLVEKTEGPEAHRAALTLAFMDQAKALALVQAEQQDPWAGPYQDFELTPDGIGEPDGLMWICNHDDLPQGDLEGRPDSKAVLLEDEMLLGPGHAVHDKIRDKGQGRYCHWGRQVYFSTSDGSDPRTNGRRYVLRTPLDESELGADRRKAKTPPALARLQSLMSRRHA